MFNAYFLSVDLDNKTKLASTFREKFEIYKEKRRLNSIVISSDDTILEDNNDFIPDEAPLDPVESNAINNNLVDEKELDVDSEQMIQTESTNILY